MALNEPSGNTLSVQGVALSLVGRLDVHGSDNMLEKGWERVPALEARDMIREEQHLASLHQGQEQGPLQGDHSQVVEM